MKKFAEKLTKFATIINSMKYIIVIKNAFAAMLPLLITGAFATLISNMVFGTDAGLASFSALSFLADLKPITDAINYAALNILTISAVFLIGSELAKLNNLSGAFPGLLAVISYIAVIPTTIDVEVNEETVNVVNVIARQFTNAQGLFLGMFIAIVSVELFSWLLKQDKLRIKMPDSVPSNVARSFSNLIPTILTVTIIATGGFIVKAITGLTLYDIIYTVVQRPLQMIVSGLPGVLLLMLTAQLFWVIGIHGNQMIKPIREPILLGAIAANMEAFNAGEPIPYIINMPFWDIYMTVGGSGMTLGLIIAIFLASKREDFRAIAKLSSIPAIFNINEPIIFGLPIVLNPILAIPFILVPLVNGVIAYFLTAIGFAGPAVVMIPWTTPAIISSYLATAGNIGAVITQIICIIVSVLIYLPFVKIADRQARLREEKELQDGNLPETPNA